MPTMLIQIETDDVSKIDSLKSHFKVTGRAEVVTKIVKEYLNNTQFQNENS